MTPASKRFLHPEAIARISRLELRARHVVEGFLTGMHKSPFYGSSVEFLQHREYVRGDDLRRIDWKVWAKQGRYYVKQFEEETDLRATLLVDVSKSMQYRSGSMSKYEYACTAAVSLAYLALRQQDAIGLLAFDDRVRTTLPHSAKKNHLMSIISGLDNSKPNDKTGVGSVLAKAAETFSNKGLMVLISDLLADRDDMFKGLRLLRQRGHDVLVLHVMDDDELDFPFNGPSRFEGLESPDVLNCNPRALRDGYLQALQKFLDDVRRRCAQSTIDYALIRTSDPLDAVLAKFLSSRLGMHGKN